MASAQTAKPAAFAMTTGPAPDARRALDGGLGGERPGADCNEADSERDARDDHQQSIASGAVAMPAARTRRSTLTAVSASRCSTT